MPDNVPPNQPPDENSKPETPDSQEAPASEPAPPRTSSPPPPTPDPAAAGPPPPAPAPQSQNRTLMLVLSYLGLLALIPLLVEKDDPEVQWHAKNGLVWTAAWIVLWVISMVLQVLPIIGNLIGCLVLLVVGFGSIIIHVMAIIKAVNGERMRLPVLSDFADQWK